MMTNLANVQGVTVVPLFHLVPIVNAIAMEMGSWEVLRMALASK